MFDLGDNRISIDVTDLSKVDYAGIDSAIRNFLAGSCPYENH